MTTKDVFEEAAAQPALIVCRTGATESLWDCHVSNLIERLEDELGVVVTGADPGQRTPSLRDAAAAARFAGCTSAVVVVSDVRISPTAIRELTAVSGVSAVVVSTPTWAVDDVVRSYRSAQCSRAHAA